MSEAAMIDALIEPIARAILTAELERAAADLLADGKGADARVLAAATLSSVEAHWRERIPEARATLRAIEGAGFKLEPAGTFTAQMPTTSETGNA